MSNDVETQDQSPDQPVDLHLAEIGQVALHVTDVEAAAVFYEETLGMKLLFKAPPGLAFFANGSTRLMLTAPEVGEFRPSTNLLYYRVENVNAATATLRDRGVKIAGEPHMITKMPDHELWMAFIEDPDGNPLAIMEERR